MRFFKTSNFPIIAALWSAVILAYIRKKDRQHSRRVAIEDKEQTEFGGAGWNLHMITMIHSGPGLQEESDHSILVCPDRLMKMVGSVSVVGSGRIACHFVKRRLPIGIDGIDG